MFRKILLTTVLSVALSGLFLSLSDADAQQNQEDLVKREILIKVAPNTIVLPEGEVAKVPISVVRIRSTELRELNAKYNAVSIEKFYEIKTKEQKAGPLQLKGLKSAAAAKQKEPVKETVDLSKIYSRDDKKELIEKGNEVLEAADVFSLHFELKPDIALEEVLSAYRAVEAVLHAEAITRKSKNEDKQNAPEQK